MPDGAMCSACAAHRADGHEPTMTYMYNETATQRSEDGYCHGYGQNGREGIVLGRPERITAAITRDELRWFRLLLRRQRASSGA